MGNDHGDPYTSPDFSRLALITIDVQRDTLDGQPFEVLGTSAALPRIRRLLDAFRRAGRPIVHIVRLYEEGGGNADLCRRRLIEGGAVILRPGTPGCELAKEILPEPGLQLDTELLLSGGIQRLGPGEAVIYKPRWGAFYNTPLEGHLRVSGVSSLAFTGCNFPNCPRASIYEASERDFRIILVEDAVSGLYDRGREEMRHIGVVLMAARHVADRVLATRSGPTPDHR